MRREIGTGARHLSNRYLTRMEVRVVFLFHWFHWETTPLCHFPKTAKFACPTSISLDGTGLTASLSNGGGNIGD
jgi:hypothetical protein